MYGMDKDYERAQVIVKSLMETGAIPLASSEELYIKIWDGAMDAQAKLAELEGK